MAKMKDEHWLKAMRGYHSTRWETPERHDKGSLHELASGLMKESRRQQERFGRLILKMEDDIRANYFDAILWGLGCSRMDGVPEGSADLNLTLVAEAVRRAHNLPAKPCGRTICGLVGDFAKAELPGDLIDIVAYYAIHDVDPAEELWRATKEREAYWGGDAFSVGMNSVRGSAACAIANLLFADESRWAQIRPAVNALCSDRTISVRSCAVRCLIALLNTDREAAVELFFRLIDGASEVLATAEIEEFVHYTVQTHYEALRPLLLKMLEHPKENARKAASGQIAVASLFLDSAKEDLSVVLSSDESCRKAAAEIFTHNINTPAVRTKCQEQLKIMFSDPAGEVRKTASRCFYDLTDENLTDEAGLVTAYLDSPAFDDGCETLVHALSNSTSLMPEITVTIPNRIMDQLSQAKDSGQWRREVYELPELLLRVYQQTINEETKLQCLDTIDRMLSEGFSDIEAELDKVER
jgi:hypothetical protein